MCFNRKLIVSISQSQNKYNGYTVLCFYKLEQSYDYHKI